MESTANQIKDKIEKNKRGKLFFPDDFAQLGTPVAIRLALSKLTKSGLLKRVAHGVYYYPAKDVKIGNSVFSPMPSVEKIAQTIAKRDKARIVPTASYALNLLGLSAQVPANVVYITDGAPRRISVGKGRGILFQHTSELKKLAYKSKLLMMIVSALREIGEGRVTEKQLEIIKSHLSHISEKELETDINLMPLWVRKLILSRVI
ncbi:hypothetical protein FACS1894199_10770 [Bacteroidia bacterium]|nr:hypothetical protein FACS1894199_10770 [Bacteroidia bacterium]